jgi:HlyD family secretion protein
MSASPSATSTAPALAATLWSAARRYVDTPRGRKMLRIAVPVAAVCLVAFVATAMRPARKNTFGNGTTAPVIATATFGPFLQQVIERGEVESSSNVEIRCQVQSRAAAGIPIIQIVPEGTYVKEGDFLVKLDDSSLQTDVVQQQIASNTSRALAVEAQAEYDATKLALQEYEAGTFRQEENQLQGDQFIAKENMRRSEEYLRYSQKLAARGYVTEVQLEADRFAVEKARNELKAADTKLEVLHRYTKLKTLNKLKADVETSEARMRTRENSHKLDLDRLKILESQLEHCIIKAPTSGQVVYANPPSSATGEPLIAEGKLVRERQIIIRLPDPKRMQVTARVNESRIDRVKAGMPVRIHLDAFPDMEMNGVVREVSEYPLPAGGPYSTMKEYATYIDIVEPPAGVRSGMTAQTSIEVEKLDQAVQIPLQAVMERGDRFFCIVEENGEFTGREVNVGHANDQVVVINDGLQPGERVILAPQNYESNVQFEPAAPKVVPVAPEKAVANATP